MKELLIFVSGMLATASVWLIALGGDYVVGVGRTLGVASCQPADADDCVEYIASAIRAAKAEAWEEGYKACEGHSLKSRNPYAN